MASVDQQLDTDTKWIAGASIRTSELHPRLRAFGIPRGLRHGGFGTGVQTRPGVGHVTGIVKNEAPAAHHVVDPPYAPAGSGARAVSCVIRKKVHVSASVRLCHTRGSGGLALLDLGDDPSTGTCPAAG
jgi:hypothetical protein